MARKNLPITTVVTAPSPATTGTSLGVEAATATRLPAVPFFATTHPEDQRPTLDNAEIVEVTAINTTTDTITITRAQKGTTAKAIAATWVFFAGEYAEEWDALEADVANKSDIGHGHAIADVTSLQGTLDGKLDKTGGEVTGNVTINGTITAKSKLTQTGGGVAINGLTDPTAPTVTNVGTAGTTTYNYYIVARDSAGNATNVSPVGSTTTGNATLSATNYNTVSWTAITGAATYDVLKTNTTTALATGITTTSVNDTGQATAAYTAPTRNATADITVSGRVDGRDVSADGTKLDGIEAGAQVNEVTQLELDNGLAARVSKLGDTMSGALGMGTNQIYNLADATAADHAVNKGQLDTKLTKVGTNKITVGTTAPASPADGDLWVDTN